MSQKIPPEDLWQFFQNGWEFVNQTLHAYFAFLSTLDYEFFIQLFATLTKLCHIKCDHPACVSVDGRHGLTENAGHENDGPSKLQDMKMQDMKLTDQFSRNLQGMKLQDVKMKDQYAGHEIAGHENDGPNV